MFFICLRHKRGSYLHIYLKTQIAFKIYKKRSKISMIDWALQTTNSMCFCFYDYFLTRLLAGYKQSKNSIKQETWSCQFKKIYKPSKLLESINSWSQWCMNYLYKCITNVDKSNQMKWPWWLWFVFCFFSFFFFWSYINLCKLCPSPLKIYEFDSCLW